MDSGSRITLIFTEYGFRDACGICVLLLAKGQRGKGAKHSVLGIKVAKGTALRLLSGSGSGEGIQYSEFKFGIVNFEATL